MPSVLITRPRENAEPLATELERLGYQAVIEPLLAIAPLVTVRPHGSFDAVIITSGSALSSLEKRQREIVDLLALPCFCVGPRTAEKARQFGFHNAQNTEGDGAELANLVGQVFHSKKSSFLHIACRDTGEIMQRKLEQEGHRVHAWLVYETIPAATLTDETCSLFQQQGLDVLVVFSPRTAETLVKLLKDHALEACCASVAAICLSDAVAGVLKPLNWRQIAAVSTPSEKAVITCLQEICPVTS